MMQISLDFISGLKQSKIMKVVKIPKGHHTYEYSTEVFNEGVVMASLDLDGFIINEDGEVVGNFGVAFNHNILAYNLKKEIKGNYKL